MTKKQIQVVAPFGLYKWAKNFKRIQDRFYQNKYKLRRIQQVEDFINLNGFKKIYHIEEVQLDLELDRTMFTEDIKSSDLVLVTHQGYSRYPCVGIVEQIKKWLDDCPDLYLCLNRHYLNIDNQKIDLDLPVDYQQAITAWLKKSLDGCFVVDMSRNYIDYGQNFTWSLPDRHYYIGRR